MLEAAKIENLWIHDLRRTLGSVQAEAGTSLVIIGKVFGAFESGQHFSLCAAAIRSCPQICRRCGRRDDEGYGGEARGATACPSEAQSRAEVRQTFRFLLWLKLCSMSNGPAHKRGLVQVRLKKDSLDLATPASGPADIGAGSLCLPAGRQTPEVVRANRPSSLWRFFLACTHSQKGRSGNAKKESTQARHADGRVHPDYS